MDSNNTPEFFFQSIFDRHLEIVQKTRDSLTKDVENGAKIIVNALQKGGQILVCGNGGSAADSQHFVAEFVCKYKKDRKPLPAIALTGNSSILTAIGNDYDFGKVFRRQIEALGRAGDVLVLISTSGTSRNILEAVSEARSRGLKTIALTGESGEDLKKETDVAIVVPSKETARIQEVHEIIYHAWCESIDAIV